MNYVMIAAGDAFPPWMLWTSIGLASAAASIFVLGAWWPRHRATPGVNLVVPLPAAGPAPPQPLAVAGAPASPDAGADRRVGFRRVGNPVEVLVCDDKFAAAPKRGWVVDRSRHGVRLSLMDKVDNGTILQVKPTVAPETVPWLAVEVRNAQPGDQSWEMGCRFMSEPSWELLLLFG